MLEFISSLGIVGYFVVIVLALCIWNLPKLIRLKSPLNSPQHKLWKATGGLTRPDHLEDENDKKR